MWGKGGTTAQRREVIWHGTDGAPDVELTIHALGGVEKFNESQLRAVRASLEHVVALSQGPPGSGQTSVVNTLAALHSRMPDDAVPAPVASATRRMQTSSDGIGRNRRIGINSSFHDQTRNNDRLGLGLLYASGFW